MAGFTVRYTLYAKAHGLTPEAMREQDEKAWPGGRCAGFILWLSKAWRDWDKKNGHATLHVRDPDEHNRFDEWLEQRQ
jgi:hypothetical protein